MENKDKPTLMLNNQNNPVFTFWIKNNTEEFIKITNEGEVFIRGNKTADDRKLYEAMCEFFNIGEIRRKLR